MSSQYTSRLDGKVAVITGAGKGIGVAIARLFAGEGAKVVVNARSEDDIRRVSGDIAASGGEAYPVAADIGTKQGAESLVAAAAAHFGQIDILVHNAGIFPYDPIEKMDDATWQNVLDTNLSSAFRLSKACLPHMQAGGGGRILFTSSVTGNRAVVPGCAHYAASKAGLNGFIKAAALEFARDGITVNGVEPGLILTAGVQEAIAEDRREKMGSSVPLNRWGTPEEVAKTMLFLASDDAAYITGQSIVIDGGATLPIYKG
jgi:3-oxoacyl-[acyl-carrier protein] reductase